MKKYLWFVDLPSVSGGVLKAQTAGVDGVMIRTTNDNFHEIIPAFHAANIQIFGWKFPQSTPTLALNVAHHAVDLLQLGMDGFIVDPEEDPRSGWNWNKTGLSGLAEEFCSIVKNGLQGNQIFGTTSHFDPLSFPDLPFTQFIEASNKVYPQAYWKVLENGVIKNVVHGKPAENYDRAVDEWHQIGASTMSIFPMGGEIGVSTLTQLQEYRDAAVAHDVSELHFYALGDADEPIPNSILTAIRGL